MDEDTRSDVQKAKDEADSLEAFICHEGITLCTAVHLAKQCFATAGTLGDLAKAMRVAAIALGALDDMNRLVARYIRTADYAGQSWRYYQWWKVGLDEDGEE